MRIALVTKRLAEHGGSERQLGLLVRGLLDAGHEVHLFCRSIHSDPAQGVHVHRMTRVPLPETAQTLLFAHWARRAITRVEEQVGPFDVRHAFGRTLGQDVYRLGGGCHRTYLDHAHALDRSWWWRRWLRRTPGERLRLSLERRMLGDPRASGPAARPHVITNSRMVADDLAFRFDLQEDHLHVIRNGVDLERFRPPRPGEAEHTRADWGLDANDDVLLFLGTGFARKGLAVLLRSLPAVAEQRPDVKLVVAGRDRHAARYRDLAQGLGVASRVTWLGAVRDPERCYGAADLLVLPTAYDPAANVTLEAMAAGLPCITTRMNGASELLEGGRLGGVLDTPVIPGELAEVVLQWLDRARDDELSSALRGAAEPYSYVANARAMLDVYARLRHHQRTPVGASA